MQQNTWRRLIPGGDSYSSERLLASRSKRESKGSPKAVPHAGPKGPQRARRARSGPEGPARGPEGPARASVARPLYLKLLTRHTIKPGTRQAKMLHMRQTKSHAYHSLICTGKSVFFSVTSAPSANVRVMGSRRHLQLIWEGCTPSKSVRSLYSSRTVQIRIRCGSEMRATRSEYT